MDQATSPPSPPPGQATADAAALPAGHRIHEYEIERPLGGGGFGITYLARDTNLQLPVAIKEYFPGDLVARGADQSVQPRTGDAEALQSYEWGLERFLDEARALATFRHPNIVRVLRYFRLNGSAYIVMEYESGLALKRWVPLNAPLSQRSLLAIVYPLLDGLEAVHQSGFLHRDIKPDNIYVRADGTPVLLDFGAARRVSANHDLTNIVSPGFAPFEQYHSQGNQGPWTDLYSLGAVMYWMTTGKKPVEAAARVKHDTLLPAAGLGEVPVYGLPLLQAIDWAMHPDETQRPQSVALMRAAIQGAEIQGASPAAASRPVHASFAPSQPASQPGPAGASGPSAQQRRNILCTIMFLDLVGYSTRSVDDQVALKQLFNQVVAKALKGVAEDSRIAVDTGDGAAICFLGDPEEALHCAMLLRDLLVQRPGGMMSARIGLHLGPVRVISDINERVNVVGDGINVAQRIMDFASANQVLVSRPYYDVLSRITDDTAGLFQYRGQYEDKHGRRHEVYAVENLQGNGATQRVDAAGSYTQTQPVQPVQVLDPAGVQEVENELARHIGPLARVLTRKALRIAPNLQALREALAPSIPETAARVSFLTSAAAGRSSRTVPGSSSSSGPASRSMPLPSQPGSHSQPLGHSGRSRPVSVPLVDVPAEELAIIEHTLSKYIGPMARMLVRKEIGRAQSFRGFVEAVADTIDQPEQRARFVQSLRRALPRRTQ